MKLTVKDLSKSYGNNHVFLNLSFCIDSQEIVSIVGPSGCGKTTLLNLIATLDQPDSGDINIKGNGECKYRIGYMMQDALLLPWRTLAENALLGTEVSNYQNNVVPEMLNHYFNVFDLQEDKQTYPNESSGGMKQRVALIRTLLCSPMILLLDEPFSNLDFDIKLNIQRHLISYHQEKGTTILLITHDIEDAIALSDKVFILSDKPSVIKAEIPIDLGTNRKDPVEARKSSKFRDYFIKIWDELKYINNND